MTCLSISGSCLGSLPPMSTACASSWASVPSSAKGLVVRGSASSRRTEAAQFMPRSSPDGDSAECFRSLCAFLAMGSGRLQMLLGDGVELRIAALRDFRELRRELRHDLAERVVALLGPQLVEQRLDLNEPDTTEIVQI